MQRRITPTTRRHEREFKGTILAIYRQARKSYHPARWIQGCIKTRVYESPQWQALTNIQRESVWGYSDGLHDYFWHDICENRVWYNDKFIPSSEVPEGEWHNVKPGATVYRASPQSVYYQLDSSILERGE